MSYKNFDKRTAKSVGGWSGRGQNRPKFVNPGLRIDVNRFINRAPAPIAGSPSTVYQPKHRFNDFALDNRLKQNIAAKGYINPTAIQDQSIPYLLQGQDVLGIADTGTGKTAAFLIPLINQVIHNRQARVLVMVPTRELALQIQEELISFSRGLLIGSAFCIGGTSIGKQIHNLRQNPHFVIGTPGRLKDLLERKALHLGNFRTVVLDEADRMLDMGFINDMKAILALLPSPRQTLLFSATLSPEIERLTGQFQNNPVKVAIQSTNKSTNIDQDIVKVSEENKIDVLHDLLIQPDFQKVLIFGQTKHGVEKLSKNLSERGFAAASIHGNKTQSARQQTLRLFKQDKINILVATDVAARGLDIPLVSHVINYDVPASIEDYIHRIGRTGRAGQTGKALTFVS